MPEKTTGLQQPSREDMLQYQQLQQQLQALTIQKQNFQLQEGEINNALKELESLPEDKDVYESVGSILLKREPIILKESLNSKKEVVKLRLESINKQVDRLTVKLQELQKKLVGGAGK